MAQAKDFLIFFASTAALAAILVTSVKAGGPWCFACNDAVHPAICQYVVQCGEHEVCSTEKVRNRNGGDLYTSSCKDESICQTKVRSVSRVTKCDECCKGTLCNEAGCNSTKVRVTGGLFCLKCDFMKSPAFCDQVELCSVDEVCSITLQKQFGVEFYNLGCRSKTSCPPPTATIAKDKSICCDSDICNSNDLGVNPSLYTTTPKPTTRQPAPPKVTVDEAQLVYNISHAANEEMQLLCHVTGGPVPQVKWTYDNGTTKVAITSGVSVEPNRDSLLSISSPQKDAAGKYTCTATNNMGKDETTIDVTVLDPPEIKGSLNESVSLQYQDSVTLDCNVTMNNDTKVNWIVPSNVKSYTQHPNNSLTIHNVHSENTGEYSCVAENQDGKTVKSFSVDVNDTSAQTTPQPCTCPTVTTPTCPTPTPPPSCPVVTNCPTVTTSQCPKVTPTPCPTLPSTSGTQGNSLTSTTPTTSPSTTTPTSTTPTTSASTTPTITTSTTTPTSPTATSTQQPQIQTLPMSNSSPMNPATSLVTPTGLKVSDQFQREKRFLNILQCPISSTAKGQVTWHRLVYDFDHSNPSYVDNGFGVLTISNQVSLLKTGVYECRVGNTPVAQFIIYEELANNVNCNDLFGGVTNTLGVVIRAKCGNCPNPAVPVAPKLPLKVTDPICYTGIHSGLIKAYGGEVTYLIKSPMEVVLLDENNGGAIQVR